MVHSTNSFIEIRQLFGCCHHHPTSLCNEPSSLFFVVWWTPYGIKIHGSENEMEDDHEVRGAVS